MIDLFGRMMQSAIAQAAQREWQKLPLTEVGKVDRVVNILGLIATRGETAVGKKAKFKLAWISTERN